MSEEMKALSLKQPWAWLVCIGYKDVENRTWRTNIRERNYIHASMATDNLIVKQGSIIKRNLTMKQYDHYSVTEMVRGAIIGEVDIKDCVFRFGEENDNLYSIWHFKGYYGMILSNPVLYDKPIPCKGHLGFFIPDI